MIRELQNKERGREVLLAPEAAEEITARRERGKPLSASLNQSRRLDGHDLRSVDEVVGVCRGTVYRWGRRAKIRLLRGKKGVACLDSTGFEAATALVQKRQTRKGIAEHLVQECGKTPGAAKKWIQRRLKGHTLEQLHRELLGGPCQDSTGEERGKR